MEQILLKKSTYLRGIIFIYETIEKLWKDDELDADGGQVPFFCDGDES